MILGLRQEVSFIMLYDKEDIPGDEFLISLENCYLSDKDTTTTESGVTRQTQT